MRGLAGTIAFSACLMMFAQHSASAGETLAQAMASAYRSNPSLLAQRRALEAVDESVSQAWSGFRPRVTAQADAAHRELRTDLSAAGGGGAGANDGSTKPRGYTISFSQNVFEGFRTVNAVRRAEADVLAQREVLRAAEQETLLAAVTAFADVLRDRATVRLRERNVQILSRELSAVRSRAEAGDASKTDVAQARARRARSLSDLALAKSNLKTSAANYRQVIGHTPGALIEPSPASRNIPTSIQAGIAQAQQENPSVVTAAFREQSAAHNVDQITGELLPTFAVEGDYTDRYESSKIVNRSETATIMGRLNLPLYQGGQVYSRIRQARRIREQRGQEIEDQRRVARAGMISQWSARSAAIAQLSADRIQVQSSRTALAGVRAEEQVGQRSVLDVLDAEQELLDAQIRQVSTKRDLIVSSYGVLSAVGRLTAADLALSIEQHDPEVHYGLVRRKPWGTRVIRNEEYSYYVIEEGVEPVQQDGGNLRSDVSRMTEEAASWLRTEVHRHDVFGNWDGATTTEVYK